MRFTCLKSLTVFLIVLAGSMAIGAQGVVTERLLPIIAASPTPIEASAFAGVTPGPDGRYYGVTYSGGSFDKGVLYSIDPAVSGITTHHQFTGGPDGGVPYDELVFDTASGKFYGTTNQGGSLGLGTVFSYVPGANGITTLRSDFNGSNQAQGPLTISSGYIFGSLGRGGASGGGAVFRMAIDGSGLEILHNFADFSSLPQALTLADGWLYGVTIYGGVLCPTNATLGCGTMFRLRRVLPGDTNTNFQTLFQFQYYRATPCPPGDPWCVPSAPVAHNHPQRTVIYGSDGWIYGQTFQRNFKIDPSNANPASTFQFIGGFTGGVSLTTIEGSDGRLYVADYGGGTQGAGEIFSMNRDGTGKLVLRDFSFTTGLRGYGPYGRLFRTASGMIYGTTEYTDAAPFAGTVFSIGSTPPLTGKIAFQSGRDGNPEIYSMDPNGSNATRLTNNAVVDYNPSISLNGSKIAYVVSDVATNNGLDEIYIMNSDGTNQTRLTNNLAYDLEPAINADASKIVFSSQRDGNYEIYVMNVDGSNQTRLTNNVTFDQEPSFSADGTKILFQSNRDGNFEIYSMNVDGSNQTRLTNNVAGDTEPVMSPDGTKIAFRTDRTGNAEIFVMDANGANPVNASNNPSADVFPTFSPNGSYIAFSTLRNGEFEIYSMTASGLNQTRLTTNSVEDSRPSWGGSAQPPAAPTTRVKVDNGNILVGSPGEGIILKSPNGATCIKIGIDNSGAMTTVVIPCP